MFKITETQRALLLESESEEYIANLSEEDYHYMFTPNDKQIKELVEHYGELRSKGESEYAGRIIENFLNIKNLSRENREMLYFLLPKERLSRVLDAERKSYQKKYKKWWQFWV